MEVWWLVGIYICILLFHLAGAHRPRSGVGNDEARALPRSAASASSSGDNNAALKQLPVPSEALELKLREKAGDVMYKFNAESDMRQTRDSTRCKLSSPHPSSPFQTSPPDSAPIVVAVGFFGLSRNLSRTVRSIRKHVFEVFDRQGIAYDVFWSTMHTALLTNLRSRENDVKLYESDHEVLQLPLCSVRVFSQANVRPRLFNHYMSRTRHDPWQDEYASLKNVLGAYYSQIKLWDQIEAQQVRSGRVYDAVLVLRPDTAILNDIDLPQYLPSLAHIARNVGSTHDRVAAVYSFTLIGEQTDLRGENISLRSLWVPSFHSYLGYNDRLAFGSAAAVQTYLTRGGLYLDATLGFNKSQGTHTQVYKIYKPLLLICKSIKNIVQE